jgi:Domain of unknown function (DUF5069)
MLPVARTRIVSMRASVASSIWMRSRLVDRARAGGSDEEILQRCFERFGRPDGETIQFWNSFVIKHGWRDESAKEVEEVKKANGLADRADVQTWVDFHDVDEGRSPRANNSFSAGRP